MKNKTIKIVKRNNSLTAWDAMGNNSVGKLNKIEGKMDSVLLLSSE